MSTRLSVSITYCVRCNFLPRALWTAHELLHTYSDYIEGLELIPRGGGVFEVRVNDELIASTKTEGGYPEIRTLKERINRLLDEEEVANLKRHPGRSEPS
ncbi:MAG TPA: Rdx family protein [Tepidiformaceae bacterium]|nr:Rdx family protein [Tepidiformaceae bacterium]